MRILYNIHNLTSANGGILQYACTLLRIFGQDVNNEYFVLHNTGDETINTIVDDYDNIILIPASVGQEKRVEKFFRYTKRIYEAGVEKRKVKLKLPTISRVERVCDRYKIDLVYCPFQEVSPTTRKQVTTLHDVQELHFPEFFSPQERLDRAYLFKKITEQSDLIVVSYEHVKKDLIKYFNRNGDDVLVCLLDMQNLWFDKMSSTDIVSLAEYKLPEDFVFYPAVTWPHKNHIGLLKAIERLRNVKEKEIHVVFTGHQTNFKQEIDKVTKQLGIENQVHWLGVVNERTLYTLYHTTKAVVVPTLYEAGSFPLMESILMGIPVICSTATSLPNTIGNESYVFDPTDISSIVNKTEHIYFDAFYRKKNVENSEKRAEKLRNTNALLKLKASMEELYKDSGSTRHKKAN